MASPFDGLKIDKNLVCEFFAVFSRFEFALKDTGFCGIQRGRAQPDWRTFAHDVENQIGTIQDQEFLQAIAFLMEQPPRVQTTQNDWDDIPLPEGLALAAIEAIKRVRNNLFHGGKHTPQSEPGRDHRLVESALVVLEGLLTCNENVRISYETHTF